MLIGRWASSLLYRNCDAGCVRQGWGLRKPLRPAKERQTQGFDPRLPVLFMDVPLFAAKLPQVRVEADEDCTSGPQSRNPMIDFAEPSPLQ